MKKLARIGARALPAVAIGLTGLSQVGAAPAEAAPALACGTVITESTTLRANVGTSAAPCADGGLIIRGGNVVLNMNGFRVMCATTPQGISTNQAAIGIHLDRAFYSVVQNGEVTGCSVGVRIDAGAGNLVRKMNAHDNIAPVNDGDNGDGVAIWNSSNNTVERNQLVHNGPYSGVSVLTGYYDSDDPVIVASGNIIRDNVVQYSNVAPCNPAPDPAPPLPARRCTARGLRTGTPITTTIPRIDPVTGLPMTDPVTGAPIMDTVGTIMRGEQTTGDNNSGIRIEGPDAVYTQIVRNVVSDNGNNGVFLQPSCTFPFGELPPGVTRCAGELGNIGTLVKDNQADWNGYGRAVGSGINLFHMFPGIMIPSFSTVVGNSSQNNYTDGIEVTSICDGNPGEVATTCAASYNSILRNTAASNRRNGITLGAGSSFNRVNQNVVTNNLRIGIELRVDMDGTPPVQVPGGVGASSNVLFSNTGSGNGMFDAADRNVAHEPTGMTDCDSNEWRKNRFGTVNQPCVARGGTGTVPAPLGFAKAGASSSSSDASDRPALRGFTS